MIDLLLAVLALAVGVALAWRAGPLARLALFGSAMLVSGLLFMPGEQITGVIGPDGVRFLRRLAGRTPWEVSDWTHFLIFAWLGLLLWLARADLRGWKGWALVVGLAVAAEWAQGLTPSREPRVDDVLVNLIGGMLGVVLGIGVRLATARGGGLGKHEARRQRRE
ncbi:VanZ family protein [Luteimonas marina]|uniref:VanZ family protein n=1 Tax=Luteimonas marina TaxID=488485 RepID=A0A5C5U672_9GAMM|nr:VanZ family protein [Luteimonas marina]TWT21105.1 VanZ family protein [Luteimonas marina]